MLLLHVLLGLVIGTLLIVAYTSNTLGAHDYKNELDSETTDTAALLQVSLHFTNKSASSERAHDGIGGHSRFVSGTSFDFQHGALFGLASNKGHETSKDTVKEWVAMAPNAASNFMCGELEWVELEYPEGVSSAHDVNMTYVSQPVATLGSWYGLDIPRSIALTGRVYGDSLYALSPSPYPLTPAVGSNNGCCADGMHVYPRGDGGKYKWIPLDKVVQSAMGTTLAHASHTFDVTKLADGTLAALLIVRYSSSKCDSIVGINLADGSLIQTATGKKSFNVHREVGTSSSKGEQRFKTKFSSSSGCRTWHVNGVQRFTSSSGVTLLALTSLLENGAVIYKDPFTHADGGKILQRFGTPFGHHFGLSSSASPFFGVHNSRYSPKSLALGGVESITIFVNSQDGKSQAYEFALALEEEGGVGDPGDDTVFPTRYVQATCSFTSPHGGGARPIGSGVFLIASGKEATGLEVVDVSGNTKSIAYPSTELAYLYDTFIRVQA